MRDGPIVKLARDSSARLQNPSVPIFVHASLRIPYELLVVVHACAGKLPHPPTVMGSFPIVTGRMGKKGRERGGLWGGDSSRLRS